MTNKEKSLKIGADVLEKLKEVRNVLILPDASRIDYDCLGSAVGLKKFLQKLGVPNVKLYIFGKIPQYLEDFRIITSEVESKYIKEIDFNFYDLIFLLDTNDWDRVLTRDYDKYLPSIDLAKIVNIDHHIDGTIIKDIPKTTINFHDVSTSKVLYDSLIADSEIELDREIAEPLYLALCGDTSIFKFIQRDTFNFAQKLIDAGANHSEIADFVLNFSKEAIDFFTLAVENTNYYPEIRTTVLSINEKLFEKINKKFGKDWITDDYSEFYKEYFQRRISGYDYGFIFRFDPDSKGTRISYRTKSSGKTLEILKLLQNLNFKAGGHRNAGGGFINLQPNEVEKKVIESMKIEILAI